MGIYRRNYINTEELQDKLDKYVLIIIGEYKNLKDILVIDKEGYKYKVRYDNLVLSNEYPLAFYCTNSYIIENIQTYLSKFNPSFIILSQFINTN